MGILLWIIFGAIVGWIASLITASRRGILWDIVIGILGSLLGGWIFSEITGRGITGFNIWSLIVAIIGSIILIWIVRAITGSRAQT